jgi:cytochrome c-type biogenesis protein CcmH/NrfG
MSAKPMEDPYGSRLAHLEGQVGGLTVQVSNLSQGMVEIGHKIDRIVDRIGSQGQVNWGWITAGVVALGAFITLYTQPLVQENEDQDRAIATLTEKQYAIREEQIKEHARIQAEHEMMMRELNKLRGFHE